jgi:hypothetical protein
MPIKEEIINRVPVVRLEIELNNNKNFCVKIKFRTYITLDTRCEMKKVFKLAGLKKYLLKSVKSDEITFYYHLTANVYRRPRGTNFCIVSEMPFHYKMMITKTDIFIQPFSTLFTTQSRESIENPLRRSSNADNLLFSHLHFDQSAKTI